LLPKPALAPAEERTQAPPLAQRAGPRGAALGQTMQLLNARPALVAQRAIAASLAGSTLAALPARALPETGPGAAPVQLMPPKRKHAPKKKKAKKKKKQKVIEQEDEEIPELIAPQEGGELDPVSQEDERDNPKIEIAERDEEKQDKEDDEESEEQQPQYSDYSDSETEAIRKGGKAAKKWRGAVTNYTKQGYDRKRAKIDNKVERGGLEAAIGRLLEDAGLIHGEVTGDRAKGATTVTTAILLHEPTKVYKRFAFCNLGLMPPALREKAEELGYHVVQAPETHAEGQLIEYLYVRSPIYEHGDMGVNREHCAECHILMKTFFGTEDYATQTERSEEIYSKYKSPSLLREAVGEEEYGPITKYRTKDGGKNKLAREHMKQQNELKKKRKKEKGLEKSERKQEDFIEDNEN
jgi:hypothetical protein